MKKLIAFFSAVTFLGSSTLAVSACGVSKGQEIEVKINNAPEKAEITQDPLVDYVYNNKYSYNNTSATYLIALAAQLASDKIYYYDQTIVSGANVEIWKEFYHSEEWRSKYFSSFNYDLTGIHLPDGEKDFSFKAKNDQDLIYQINGNDSTVDDNKLRIYWFTTSANRWNSEKPEDYQPTKENIAIPELSDFNEENDEIIKTGWLHFYLIIGSFRIDFTIEINFNFSKITDKNGINVVILNLNTFAKPFGDIKFDDHEEVANKKVSNLYITKQVPEN